MKCEKCQRPVSDWDIQTQGASGYQIQFVLDGPFQMLYLCKSCQHLILAGWLDENHG